MTPLRTALVEAWSEFNHHRLRTLLTLSGMIFGVAAVVSMQAVGRGAEQQALDQIESLGIRNVIIEAAPPPRERLPEIREDSIGLSLRDRQVLIEALPGVERSSATKRVDAWTVFSDRGRGDPEVWAVTASHVDLVGLEVVAGRALTDEDDDLRRPVCLLGEQIANTLFGDHDPIAQPVKINRDWFTVVGVLADRGLSSDSFEGIPLTSPHNQVLVPLGTAAGTFRFDPLADELDAIHLEVAEAASIDRVARGAARILEDRHEEVDDWRLVVPEQLLNQHRETQRIFDIVMAAIAGISLLVGGIGIMNIMLATVLERTREIGIRRALGAKRNDILGQFLIEAVTIAGVGGLLGLLFGIGLASGIATWSGWPVAWSATGPILAITVCATIGLLSGLYPAIRAARLDPVRALERGL